MTTRTTREDLLALLAVSRFGVCAMASDGRFVFWNRSAERIAGLTAAQVLGRRHDEIVATPASQRTDDNLCWNGLEGCYRGCATRPVTALLLCGSGEEKQITLTPIIVANDSGDDALTLWLFDTHAHTRESPPASPADPAPKPELASAGARETGVTNSNNLTRREIEVLRLVAAGTNTDQIASDLSISIHTVRNHVRSLRNKLDAKTKLDAVVTAMRAGLL